MLSQARLALSETAEMWQNLITHVQPSAKEAQQQLEEFSGQIFNAQKTGKVSDRRQLKQLASLMGVSKKKARLVAEVFNPTVLDHILRNMVLIRDLHLTRHSGITCSVDRNDKT